MTKHDEPLKWVSEARVSLFDDEAKDVIHNNIELALNWTTLRSKFKSEI